MKKRRIPCVHPHLILHWALPLLDIPVNLSMIGPRDTALIGLLYPQNLPQWELFNPWLCYQVTYGVLTTPPATLFLTIKNLSLFLQLIYCDRPGGPQVTLR